MSPKDIFVSVRTLRSFAGSSREHWEFYDDAMRTSDKWIHTLLAHLKQQYKYAADYITRQSGGKGQHKVGGQSSTKGTWRRVAMEFTKGAAYL